MQWKNKVEKKLIFSTQYGIRALFDFLKMVIIHG